MRKFGILFAACGGRRWLNNVARSHCEQPGFVLFACVLLEQTCVRTDFCFVAFMLFVIGVNIYNECVA